MAEENQNKYEESNTTFDAENPQIKDRGVFDFLGGKKKDEDQKKHQQEELIATEFDQKVTLSDQLAETKKEEDKVEVEVEEEKKHNILEKLHLSGSSSSSSSEEEGEDGEKKKKKKKEKKKVVEEDNSVEVEKVEVVDVTAEQPTEEKKGFLEKIKDKLPGHKKTEDVVVVSETTTTSHDESEKKGILEKIKEKLPGYHPKTTTELDDKDHHKDNTTTSH